MTSPAQSTVQNLLPVQAYFTVTGDFIEFIGQNKPFFASIDPYQSGLHITNSTIDSTTIGATTPSTAHFLSGQVDATPTGATDIANKNYVDYAVAGASWKPPANAATTVNITLSGLQTIDTVSLVAGNTVLVKDQTNQAENGIYKVSSGPWSRAPSADTWSEYEGAIIYIESGGQATTAWYCTAQPGGTLGVTAIQFFNLSFASGYTAGTGLTLLGTQFSISNTGVTAGSYGSASKTLTAQVNAQGQLTSLSASDISINGNQITSGTIGSSYLSGSYTGITTVGTLTGLTVSTTINGSISGNAATATLANSATTSVNLSGGTTGSLPYQSGAGATTFLAPSTNGYVLTLAAGVPSWAALPASGVTSVTASAPLSSSGGTTPNISISQATTSTNGYLSSTDWNTFNNKANSGANSNITSLTGLTGGIATPNFITFNTSYATALTAGQLGWDSTNNNLAIGMAGGNVTQHIGEDQYLYIKASATITKGQVIMFTGSVGASGILTGAPATGITDGTYIMGIAAESIALNAFGFVQTFGVLNNVNTSGIGDGEILWYDPTVTGGFTATKPSAPNVKAQVAACNKGGSSGGGVITIRINPGSQLGGTDSNVQFGALASGQTIIYDNVAGYWKNATLTAGSGVSITNGAGSITIASTGLSITDDTSTNATRYPLFAAVTTGTLLTEYVSSTKFQFNPSTGTLTTTNVSTGALTATGTTTLATSLSGLAKLTSGVVSTATAGTDYVAPATATTFTATQTFSGSSSTLAAVFTNAAEVVTVSATAATGTINYDVTTQSVLYYTTSASANWTVNFRASSGTSLNTAMSTGQSMTVVFLVTQGATAYYNNAITIDGTSVTPKYQGGTAWTSGNASGVDAYSYTIVKTGSATFTVFASQTQFK